jgi:hypothetical protein
MRCRTSILACYNYDVHPSVEVMVLSGAANPFKDTLKASMLVVKWGVDLDKGWTGGNWDDDGLEYDEGAVNGVFSSRSSARGYVSSTSNCISMCAGT